MTGVIGNQTRIHRGSALRFDAAFQLLAFPVAARGLVSRLQVSLGEPPHISVILMDRQIDKVPQRNGFMRLLAYDLTPDGTASNQRVLVDYGNEAGADGIAVDALGLFSNIHVRAALSFSASRLEPLCNPLATVGVRRIMVELAAVRIWLRAIESTT